jgi:hypothetical protein
MKKPLTEAEKIRVKEAEVIHKLEARRESVYARFPLLFTLLGTFGLVATFYGFEHLIDQSRILSENPLILLAVGISTLIVTGRLYKKLD